jgi:Glycosyltransferase family 87
MKAAEFSSPTSTSPLKRIIAVALLACSILLLAVGLREESGNLAKRDFIAYWSAGQLLVHHGNPYSDVDVYALEKQEGFREAGASTMLNPPWAMIFVLPLGFVSAYVGALMWILLIVACIMVSVRVLQTVNHGEGSQDHLLAYAFAPVLACIMGGQMSGFTCLSISLFLLWINTRPFLAGVAAIALTIKPHLFGLFFLILLIDSIRKKDLRAMAGVCMGLVVATAVPLAFNHHLLMQFLVRDRVAQIGEAFIPTVSFVLRLFIHRNSLWIQFLPEVIAIAWGIWYYHQNRKDWHWNKHGLLVLVVSLWAAPYSTFLDELVLMPAVVSAIYLTSDNSRSGKGVLPAYFVLNGIAFALLFAQVPVMSGAYIWTTTAWLIWYVFSVSGKQRCIGVESAVVAGNAQQSL